MRIVKMLIALPMILLLGIIRLLAPAISWLYCRATSLVAYMYQCKLRDNCDFV